ncbi:uncharacterized protein LOC109503744 isoform X2 [Harpegnathos saltator]|uniref:uncharacterized protein LOC109503744 isoform X2 n=1 Tax=Harpegnathos saltator TaxID=610380 RepID=UPI000DBEE3F6|nr:uncharacterized protein LOC109503744 isoform X2 [Harpegnathos saltator]
MHVHLVFLGRRGSVFLTFPRGNSRSNASPSNIHQGGSGTTSLLTPQVLNQIVEEQPVAQATGQLSHQVCPLVDPAIYDKSWQREDITDCLFYLATPVFSKVDKIEPLAPGTVVYADTLVKEITRRTGDRGTVHAVDRARPSYILGRQRICVLDVPSWKFSIECVSLSPPEKSGITSILRSAQEVM